MNRISPPRLGLRALHNGKGRPALLQPTRRNLSSRSVQSLSPPTKVKDLLRSSHPSARTFRQCFPAIRYASTSSQVTTESPPPIGAADSTNAWEGPLDIGVEAPFSMEPHIGWLKELGIDYGWGPTSLVQWVLEHTFVYSGLPWAGAVVLSAVLFRTALFKFFLDASDTAARQAVLTPYMKPLQEKLIAARFSNDQALMMQAMQEQREIYKKAGIKLRRMFMPALLQMPLGFGTFFLTRKMAELPVPGLDVGGFLWLTDLTTADPTYLLPLFTSGMLYFIFKRGGESGVVTEQSKRIMSKLSIALPAISFIFVCYLPAITQVAFAANSILSFAQAQIFRNNVWRERLGIHPLKAASAENDTESGPYKGVINRYQPRAPHEEAPKGFFGILKAKATEYMRQRDGKAARLSKQEKDRAERYEQQRRNEIEADIVDRERERRRR